MRAMAYKFLSSLKNHPLITAVSVLLLFTLPLFHILMFFGPLIASTVLGVLAVISFDRQKSDEHATPSASCTTAESAPQSGKIAFPSREEKISNVLMVENQEVTWLEWLHYEDTRKLCAHGRGEHAVWDAYGCDISTISSEASICTPAATIRVDASNGHMCADEIIGDSSLQIKDKGSKQYACGSEGEDDNVLVLTEENETWADGFRGAATVPEDVDKEKTKMNAPIMIAEGKANLNLLGEVDRMCRSGMVTPDAMPVTLNGECKTHTPACAEGGEGQMSADEGPSVTGGGENECRTMPGLLNSTIHPKNKENGYPSAGSNENTCNVEATDECNTFANSFASTTDMEGMVNECVSEGETSLHVPSRSEAPFVTSEPKVVRTHEQGAPGFSCSNKTFSPLLEMEGAEVHKMQHVDDEQDEVERGSNQLDTQGPQLDMSDGEEDRSSLRFSFFHNSCLTPSEA